MTFIETANTLADILDKHEAETGKRFYSGYENVEHTAKHNHAEWGIDEYWLADSGKIYFIYNYDRGNGIVEPILNELTIHTVVAPSILELVVLTDDSHVPMGYGATSDDRKARAMMAKLAETLTNMGRRVVMTSEPELSCNRFGSDVKCLKSIWSERQALIDFWAPAKKETA